MALGLKDNARKMQVLSASFPETWEALQRIMARYAGQQMQAVYEPDILASGFMTAWWLMAPPVWLPLQVWCPGTAAWS